MHNKAVVVALVLIALIAVGIIGFTFSPVTRGIINTQRYAVQKVDDATNYQTIKMVENNCRAMIASYNSDRITYEQYRESDNEEKQSWAEQAKMRANRTAMAYNEYVLKNSFIWRDNVPEDIQSELELIS